MSASPSDKACRVAIVGLGRMASTIDDELPGSPPYSIAAACASSPRFQVIAGADIDPAKRDAFRQRWGVTALYEDYLQMIRQEQPDLVAICTRGPLHAEMAVKTAEAGVPMIYSEKAMACSMREADAVRDAVLKHKTLYNTGVLRRFDKRYHQMRDMIAAGAIGDPLTAVHFAKTNVLHGHSHSIDTLMFLLGDPQITSVWGEIIPRDTQVKDNRLDNDPNAIFEITTATGVEMTSIHAGTWEFEVIGTKGSLRILNNGQGLLWRQTHPDKRNVFESVPVQAVPQSSATLHCLEDLLDARQQGRQTLGHVEVTHHITEACVAIVESHRVGRRVALPLTNRDLYIFHR